MSKDIMGRIEGGRIEGGRIEGERIEGEGRKDGKKVRKDRRGK